MAYNTLNCGTNLGNTGLQKCKEDFGVWEKLILVPADLEIESEANGLLEETWIDLINSAMSSRAFPLPIHFNAEPNVEEAQYAEGWNGKQSFVREGKDIVKFTLEDIAFYNHKELRKHNGRSNLGVYILTSNGYILGYSKDDTKFLPLSLEDFRVEKRSFSDGSDVDRTMINVVFGDAKEWNDNGVWLKPTLWNPLLLDGVKDVSLTATLVTATGCTINVAGVSDGVALLGLALSDFSLIKDSDSSVVTITSVTPTATAGEYTIVYPSITGTHSLNLVNQPAMTLKGYESIAAATLIPA